MKNKGILISDAHIKSRLWTNFPGIQGDSYEALKIVQEKAKGSFVISCGDLFDSNRPSSTDLKAVSDMLREIKVLYYVNGNHDDVQPSIVPSLGSNVVHLTPEQGLSNGKTFLMGIDWCNTKELLVEQLMKASVTMKELPECFPVLILHQSLDVFFLSHIITLKEIREILDHPCDIFVGDIHMRKLVKSSSGDTLSPGPLVPQDIGQAKSSQFITEIDFSNPRAAIKDIPVKVRDYWFLEVNGDSYDLEKELSKLPKSSLPLKPAVILKAPQGYKLPKGLPDDFIIVLNIEGSASAVQKTASAETSLEEAINKEIEETEGDLAKLMKPLVGSLLKHEAPDEALVKLLNKWEVIRT